MDQKPLALEAEISELTEDLQKAKGEVKNLNKAVDRKAAELKSTDARYWSVFNRLQVSQHEVSGLLETEKKLTSEIENLHLEIFVLNRRYDACEEKKEELLAKKNEEILSLKMKVMKLEDAQVESEGSDGSWSEVDDVEEDDTEKK